MTPWLADPDVTLYHGDALQVLRQLPDGSVDCVVTSPPYWGLRCYGVDGQYGLEETPDQFVAAMVELFREVRRVLADHGTCWVNLGDSYNSPPSGRTREDYDTTPLNPDEAVVKYTAGHGFRKDKGLKPKDLVGIPWRVAFALQQDGWYLRADIIWAKPNPMPESVTDRPTKAHEYVFLLTKRPRYWFDSEAVREDALQPNGVAVLTGQHKAGILGHTSSPTSTLGTNQGASGRNVRSVWQIATQPYPEAHFATFPEELARRCILAGCPTRVCRVCGKPSERIVGRDADPKDAPSDYTEAATSAHKPSEVFRGQGVGMGGGHKRQAWLDAHPMQTLGWSDCGHNQWRPGIVLDPFIGSGTVAKVARDHQRHAIGIDLNLQYLKLARRRLQQLSLLTEPNRQLELAL